ncbi:hypothetical protein [Sulfitobacter guttiformis]|uniref:hypothetical protein n=1 Tax=Sulfitobacter guttiformis TaxID=74349 RepID=UPI0011C45F64|nr:hypothetical protein [Sulfitobacter guttiformis]KIN73369.1 LysE family protein [Sulfitobacter guttiformis KCTC 32187]
MLNPKRIALLIVFVLQITKAGAALLPQLSTLVVTVVMLAALNALAYALAADRLRCLIARPNIIAWITRAGGVALIMMGVLTATLRRSTT